MHSKVQRNEFRTKKRILVALLGVTSRLASGELLIKTPALAGGKAGHPTVDVSHKPGLLGLPRLANSVHPSGLPRDMLDGRRNFRPRP
jgi:hypothetical protein